MSSVYEGGVPDHGAELFPKTMNEAEETQAYGGEEGIKTTHGGPATNSGADAKAKSFLDDKNYDAGSMEAGRPSGMNTIDWNSPK